VKKKLIEVVDFELLKVKKKLIEVVDFEL